MALDETTGTVYIDLAGLQDSNGDTVEMFNWLIFKQVFRIVGSFYLIVPITFD